MLISTLFSNTHYVLPKEEGEQIAQKIIRDVCLKKANLIPILKSD
jgi:hypothetical protein